jgi:hypothetical protein
LAEAALGEGSGAKLHKLSVKDIKYVSELFLNLSSHYTNWGYIKLFGMGPKEPNARAQANPAS